MTARLTLHNIHKQFGPVEVLKGISLEARQGDVISLIGASGSGKSTLLRCANLLEIPDQGDITLGDTLIQLKRNRHGLRVPVKSEQVDNLRTRVGMVFQGFNLWDHMTILDNIIEAPVHVLKKNKKQCREQAMDLLSKVGISDKASCYPAQLSGGQRQRAAIARALMMKPEVLLFDEPTASLDPELVGEVLKIIKKLARDGRTMLVVTHEMGFAREISSKVIFLHQGKIAEQGSPEQIFQQPQSDCCRQFLRAIK